MNVLMVHNKPLTGIMGGAELSLKLLIAGAPEHVNLTLVSPDTGEDCQRYDAIIVNNIRPEGGLGEDEECSWAHVWADKLRRYEGWSIRSEHDVHPCGHRDARCIELPSLKRLNCTCGPAIPRASKKLYASCRAVQYLSPAHRDVIRKIIKVRSHEYVIASPIDFTTFRSWIPWASRKRAALVFQDAQRLAPGAETLALDQGFSVEYLPYLSVPYETMPELLNGYQAILMAPAMFHAFGRLAVEAMACGCRVISNGRVGAFSWSDPADAAKSACEQFWRMVLNPVARRRWYSCLSMDS